MYKTAIIALFSILTLNTMAQEKITQTAGRTQLGEFAPKFAELNDKVLSPREGQEARHNKKRDSRPADTGCLLCRMAQCLGWLPCG